MFLFLFFFLFICLPPSFSSSASSSLYSEQSLHVQLVEECPFGSSVLRLPSLPPSFSPWHLSPSAYSSLVSLNASSGDLFTSGRIDRESLPIDAKNEQILLEFVFVSRLAVTKRMASPSAPSLPLAQSFRLFRLTVEILDVNDNAPIFGTEQLNLSISESASPGSRFTLGKARDSDAGNNGTIGGCELMPLPEVPSSEDISEYFHAEKDPTGDLVLELNNKQMDREQTDYLRGRLKVWDAGAPRREAIVGLSIRLLDANDNAPRFEQTLYNLTFEENERMASEKVKLGKVRATDLDEGENGRVKYEMNGESDGALEVDERSGELFIGRRRMAKNVCPPNGPPSECLFVVNAIDGGVPPLSAKATVLVKLAKEKEEGTNGTERSEQRRRKKQAKIRIKNFPAGQTFASLGSESPNGTVISVVTMENTDNEEEDGEKEQQQTQFVIRGTQQMFRLEQLRNGLALIRWNGTAQNAGGNGRHWTLEIGRKRSEDGREIGPTEKVQVFLRPSSSDQSDQLAFLPPPPLLPLLHIVRLPVDFPLGSLVLRLNSSSSSFSSHFQLVSSEWDHIFELHPVAGLLRLKMPFPQLGDGETGRNITVKVEEMARDQSAEQQQEKEEKLAQIEVQIELFDVNNQQRPLIAGCAPTDSPCVLSLRLAEDFPLGVSLFSLFSLNASDSALRFSLRPFSSDFASLALFTIDAQLGIVSLRQSLDFERSSEHRFWVEVTDRETPPGRAKAILEVFVEDVNDEVPQFAPPAAVFLSLPLSLPASSVLLSVSATDSDFVDLRFGLRYELLENYGTFPRGMFQLAGDQLILVKSPASFGLKANDQFVFQIGAMDLANHSAPSPLNVNVRIVAAEAKVPLRKASLNLTMGQCLSEDDILKNVSAFVPRDGPRFVNLSLLHGDPSLLLFRSSPLSLCLRFSPSFSPKLPSHFLLADFGSVGWTLIELRPSIPPTDRPRLTFVDASHNITVVLSETAIGTPLHRFRVHLFGPRGDIRFKLEDDQLGILGLHPTEGLLWLARNERSKGRETEMAVVAQFGEEKRVVARQKFWLKIEGDDDQTGRDLLRFPASLSLSVPIDASLRPGDLLANLASLFPTSHRFKLFFNFHAQNLSSNWPSDEFIALFPNGEIRLLKQPPFGINIWQREVKVQQQEKRLYYSRTDKLKTDKWSTDKWSMIGERIVPVRLIIKNPLRSVDDSLLLHCPNPPQRFLWHNDPPGTFVGTLAERQNFSGGTERIKRIELLDHLDLFLVDELSGNIHIRTREKLIDRGGQLDIRYRIGEAGEREKEKRRECETKVELMDPFARKEEKRRENIIRREISQRIAAEKMRHDGMAFAEKEGRNWHNGTQCQLEKAVMRDELGAAQKFEFRRCRLFASPISSFPSRANGFDRPFFLLTPSSASSSPSSSASSSSDASSSSSASSSSAASSSSSLPPSVRLRLVPPLADHLLHVQMSILPLIPSNFPSSSSSSIAIPRGFPLGVPFLQIQLHFHPQIVEIVVSNAPHFSPRFQLQLLSPADDYASSSSASSSASSSSSTSSSSSASSSSDFVLPFLHLCPLSGLLSLQTHSVASDYAIELIVQDEWTGAKGSKKLELHFLDDSEQSDRMMNFIRQNLSMNFDNYSSNSFSLPAFSFWVAENAAIGTIVGQFDQKLVNEQTTLIGAEEMPFALNIKNGTLTVIGPIDAEKASLFSFHLNSDFDDAIELLRIDVHVRDENEHLPTVEGVGGALLVTENIPIGGRILRIDMRDEDRTSELVAFVDPFLTDEHNAFFVDEKGWLKVGAKLDRERREEYQVIIRLMDAKPPKKVLFSSLILNISVSDENDCAPQFPAPFLDFFVGENSPPGTVFGTILATDEDKGENGTVRYRMVGDCPDQLALDPLFGYLTVIGAIDRELLTAPMEFVAEAFDLGVPQQRSAVKVRVHVVDQDDIRPEPEQQHVEMALIEGTPAGEALIRLSYKDTDEGSNAVALFAIVKGTKSNGRNGAEKELIDDQFHVGAFSGVLSVAMPLDESIQANDTIHLNISMTAFTGRWPPSFISVSLLVVPRTASSPPPSLLFQHVRLFLHPLITFPFVFHRIAPPQPNCSFVLLNQSRLFSLHTMSGFGFVRLLRLPPSDRLPSSASSVAADSADRSFALSVLVSSPSLSSASVLLTLFVHFSSPFSSASLLLSPPVQFVRIAENKSLFWEVKVNADQTEEGQIGDGGGGTIRYKMVEEYCEEERKTEEKEGNREEEDERAADDEEVAKGTTTQQHQMQFEIDPINGIVRSRTELSAKKCSLWTVRVGAFHVIDEWNLNGAKGNDALIRIRVSSPASSSSASSSASSSSPSSASLLPAAHFGCIFLFPSANSSSSSSVLPSPFAIIRIDENEMPSSDAPIARVGVLSAEEDRVEQASSIPWSSLPLKFEMDEGPSRFLFRLDRRKGTIRMAKAMDRERDGGRHRMAIWGRIGPKMRTKMPCILEVIVNDVNDNAPRFGHILYLSLNRSTPVGSVVFRVRIEDPDLAENARNWFSLSGEGVEEAERLFSIDKWTGEMTLIRELTGEKINALRFGITAQDEKWHVQSIMTVQIVEDENEQRTNRMSTEAKTFEFVAFGEGGDQRTEAELAQTEQLGRVPGRCYAMPTIGWAWTKHEGTETALIADRRLFKLLERGEGTAEREVALFCADGIGQQKVRLRWRRSPADFPSYFPPINLPIDHSSIHPSTSVHLFFIPYPNSLSLILPPTSIPSLPIADRSKTAQIGRVIVEDGEEENEENEQTEHKWHFELEDQWDQSWIRVDKRSGILSANASAIAFPTDWTDGQKLIGVKVTDENGQRKGMGKFRVIWPLSTSVLTPKFVRRIWHFSVPRHSPNGTIVGQLQIDGPKGNKIWQIVMDAKSEKAFDIDQTTGELTIRRREERTNLKRKKKVANGGGEEAEEATIVVALIGAAGGELFDRCVVRVFFSRLRPPCVAFPSPHFSVRLSSTASDQTVLLRFDIIRHTDFKIVLSDPPQPLPFCFSARSPSVLSLCSSLSPLRLSSLSSSVPLLLFLLLLHPSGRVCSRSSVSVLILPSSTSFLPLVPVGGVGFVRRNALPGQNVLKFRSGPGPFEMVDQQMDKLFRLHPSSGVLSTRISFVGLRLPSLLPIVVRSHNVTFHLVVLLKEQQWKNANVSSDSNAEIGVILPVISSGKTTHGKEELQLLATEYANSNRRRCVPTSKRLGNEFRSNVTITSSCSLLLSPLPLSSVPSEFVPLGNGISLRIDSLHLLVVLPRLVELRLFSSTKNLATILGAIERAVPDLVLLLPFVLSADFSAPFGFHRLLIAFRDQNGNILAQSDSVRLLQHFFITFSDLSDNSWNLRVEETNFQVEEEKGILDCLKGPREVIGTAQKVWAPIKANESCLRLGPVFTPKCPSSPIASANELISAPVLSFMPSGNFNDHFGFVRFSGILLPRVRLISFQFLTAQSSALLLYFSLDSASSFFLSVDLINGKPRLNVGLTLPLQSRVIEKSVNDEKWWHLELSWTKGRVTLALAECQREEENGDECAQMSHGVHRVHVQLLQANNLLLHPPSLRFSSSVIFGDLSALSDLFRHSAGRTSDFSFVGCQRRIAIDGIEINGQDLAILEERLDQFMAEINATSSSMCPLIGGAGNEWPNVCHGENARKACGKGICVPKGSDSFICQCESQQVESANCEQVLSAASLRFRPLRFVLSSRTFNRLSFVPLPGNLVHSLPRRPSSVRRGEDENIQFAEGLNVFGLDFHSSNSENGKAEQSLLCIEFEDLLLMIAVEMSVNSLRFVLHRRHTNDTQPTPFTLSFQLSVNSSTPLDIHWHRLAMGMSPDGTMLRLQLDDMAPIVHRSSLPNFFPFPLRSRLKLLSLGSTCSSLNAHQNLSAFRGCVRRFLINNQLQQIHPQMAPLPSHKRFLRLLIEENQPEDAISQLCLSAKSAEHAIFASTFAVISVLFLLSFVLFAIVFRFKRRKRKESAKRNKNVQISSSFVTQSQTPTIIVPSQFNGEEEEQKMAKLENWRAMAVSTDTFSSLGFSSCSTFPRHSNIIGPSDAEDSA